MAWHGRSEVSAVRPDHKACTFLPPCLVSSPSDPISNTACLPAWLHIVPLSFSSLQCTCKERLPFSSISLSLSHLISDASLILSQTAIKCSVPPKNTFPFPQYPCLSFSMGNSHLPSLKPAWSYLKYHKRIVNMKRTLSFPPQYHSLSFSMRNSHLPSLMPGFHFHFLFLNIYLSLSFSSPKSDARLILSQTPPACLRAYTLDLSPLPYPP